MKRNGFNLEGYLFHVVEEREKCPFYTHVYLMCDKYGQQEKVIQRPVWRKNYARKWVGEVE